MDRRAIYQLAGQDSVELKIWNKEERTQDKTQFLSVESLRLPFHSSDFLKSETDNSGQSLVVREVTGHDWKIGNTEFNRAIQLFKFANGITVIP